MRSIDERIVDMQFNNKQFEDGIQTSLKSLDNLKKGLDDTGKNTGLSVLQSGVEAISNKFSALSIIGITALQNITNAAINTGTQLLKSLTVDNVTEGFTKYEQKTTAVQTILNATGKSMEEVEEQLEKLNWFTDETSYNFIDMVSNIGKFTSSGVELDVAVTAMQGIANWAALSGQGTNEASRAMYNLAQSIGMGAVKLQDWKSIENANMATKEFKEIVIETAKSVGTLSKDTEVNFSNFSSTLSEGWFTSEVLLQALDQYGNYSNEVYKLATERGLTCAEAMKLVSSETMTVGEKAFKAAQEAKTFTDAINAVKDAVSTGWMTTFEIIFGDYYEAKELWTDVANGLWEVFASGAEARNEMLQEWKNMGGRDTLIDAFKSLFDGLSSVIAPAREAFQNIFPPMTAEKLFAFTEGLKTLADKIKITDVVADKIRRSFEGLFAAIDLVKQFFSAIFKGVGKALAPLTSVGGQFLDVTAGIGDFIVSLRDAAAESGFFYTIADGIASVLTNVFDIIGTVVSGIDTFSDAIWNAAQQNEVFQSMVENITSVLSGLESFIGTIGDGIKKAVEKISEQIQAFGFIDLNPLETFAGAAEMAFRPFVLVGVGFQKAWEIIVKIIDWASPILQKAASVISESLGKLWDAFGGAVRNGDFASFLALINTGLLGAVILGIKDFVGSLKDVAGSAGGFLDGIKEILDGVRGCLEAYQTKLKAQALLTIAGAIAILAAALWVISGIPADKLLVGLGGITALFAEMAVVMTVMGKSFKTFKGAGTIMAFSAAILILAVALKMLAELDWDELQKGIAGITVLLVEFTAVAMILSNSSGKLIKGSVGLIAFATAILILAQAVKTLGQLDTAELAKGLLGVGTIMAEVAGFTQIVKPEKLMGTGVAMIAISAALKIMVGVVRSLGELDLGVLTQGLIGLGFVFAEIAGFTHIVKPEKLMSTGVAMIAMGAALKIIASAVADFGDMSLEDLAKGLIAMGVALATIAGFTHIVKPEKLMSTGVAMIAMGAALLIIAQAIQGFGGMSWEELAKGLVALGGALLIIAVATNAMKGAAAGAAAMLVFAAALRLMVPALLSLGKMSWGEIGKSLLMLAGVFVVFGASAVILAPLIPVMLGLAGAIALLGVGVLALGIGMVSLSAGLTAFALGGPAFIIGLTAMIKTVILLIPTALAALAEGFVLMIATLADGIGTIIESLIVVAKALIEAFVELVPSLVEAVFVFLTAMADAIIEFIPKLVELGMTLLLSLLRGIEENIQEVVSTALFIVAEFLRGIADGLPSVVEAAVDVIIAFIDSIGKQTPRIVDAAFKMIIDFVNGLADAIRDNTGTLVESMVNLASALIEGLIDGLFAGVTGVVDAIVNVARKLWEGFRKFFGIRSPSKLMAIEGENVSKGLQEGVKKGENGAVIAMKNMGKAMLNSLSGTVDEAKNIASNIIEGFRGGIGEGLGVIGIEAKKLGNKLLEGIKGSLGIKSPSKRMAEVGEYSGLGLIKGLNSMASTVSATAGSIGDTAVTSMQKSLANVSGVMLDDMDMSPTIRPVLDMSEVTKCLDTTFSKGQSLNIGEIKGRTASVATSVPRQNGVNGAGVTNTTDNSEQKIEIVVHNHVRNDSDIQKINRGLDNIITKYRRTKGVPVFV